MSTPPATGLSPAETARLTTRGLRLAQFTVAYNVVEGTANWKLIGLVVSRLPA
jgi:rhodanese-related sulfurtransferase